MKSRQGIIIFTLLLVFFMFNSCSKESDNTAGQRATPVSFTADVESNDPTSRVIDNQWEIGDEVGIYMIESGKPLSESSVIGGYGNVKYQISAGDKLVPTKGAINFPEDNQKVDFVAYYPFKETNNNLVELDVSNQEDQGAIDLLYSDNAKEQGVSKNGVSLRFWHQLSKLEFSVIPSAGKFETGDLTAKIVSLPTKATFDLSTTEIVIDENSAAGIPFKIESNGDGTLSATAILLPTNAERSYVVEVAFSDGGVERFTVNAPAYKKGAHYKETLKVAKAGGDEPGTPNPDPEKPELLPENKMWLELPVVTANADMKLVSHMIKDNDRNYAMLYDSKNMIAHWVAYPLHKSHMGSTSRSSWRPNPLIDSSKQAQLSKSYPAFPAYNRGHQIASSDRTVSRAANQMTFYYTNSMPQNPDFNSGVWNKLERAIQGWATNMSDTLYVVTGAMIVTKDDQKIEYTRDNGSNMVAVPKHCYKALAKKVGGVYYTIAYKMPNVKPDNKPYSSYQMTVAELEEETGVQFFPNIPEENKRKIVESQWR